MADKNFVLTLVAVLALAVIAGSLKNSYSYSGALTGSGLQPGTQYGSDAEIAYGRGRSYAAVNYRGNLQKQSLYQQATEECERMYYDEGTLQDYTAYRNCLEAVARGNLPRSR